MLAPEPMCPVIASFEPGRSKLRNAYVLFALFSESLEKEDREANKRHQEEGATQNQIRSFRRVPRLVQILV